MRIMHCIVCNVQDGCSSFLSGQVDRAGLQHGDDDNDDADDDDNDDADEDAKDDDNDGGILLIHISKERCLAKRYLCNFLLCNKDLFNLDENFYVNSIINMFVPPPPLQQPLKLSLLQISQFGQK